MLYLEYLRLMHDILNPDAYLEIGVSQGDAFSLSQGLSIGIDRRCQRPRRARCKIDRRPLKLRGDAVKRGAEVGSDQLKRADRGNRDQGGDEAIFDGSRAILVLP